LALDLEQIRHDLELNPWIERADVEAIRPDRLRLGIREREPVAQVVVVRPPSRARHRLPSRATLGDWIDGRQLYRRPA
jgi:hypothetical protein